MNQSLLPIFSVLRVGSVRMIVERAVAESDCGVFALGPEIENVEREDGRFDVMPLLGRDQNDRRNLDDFTFRNPLDREYAAASFFRRPDANSPGLNNGEHATAGKNFAQASAGGGDAPAASAVERH